MGFVPGSFLVFFMQVGFVVLETGSSRAKNAKNILMKNMVDVMICALAWWAVGYALAYGASAGGIIGCACYRANCLHSRLASGMRSGQAACGLGMPCAQA